MSIITYKADHKLEHKGLISKNIMAHNEMHTGKRDYEEKHYYVFNNQLLVGYASVVLAWDWIHLGDLWFENDDVLRMMINQVSETYKSRVVGIQYNTYIDSVKKSFLSCDFYELNKIPDMPIGRNTSFLFYNYLEKQDVSTNLTIEVYDEINKQHIDIVKEKATEFQRLNKMILGKTDLSFLAYDENDFVGGVYGYLELDHLYVNLIVVLPNYRDKKIASNLMNLLEDEGRRRGIKVVYLGTCDFQAYDFYVKLGYSDMMTIKDYPKGFKEYTFIKDL